MSTTGQRAVAQIMCARCEARPGQQCVTVTGRRASYPHGARLHPLYEEWSKGYGEGGRDAVDTMRRYLDRDQAARADASSEDSYPLSRMRGLLDLIERQFS